jgi:phosphate-selective porin OprO/OprP
LEGAAVWGPFSVQGEYAHLGVDLPGGSVIRNTSLTSAGSQGLPPFFGTANTNLNPVGLINNPLLGLPNPSFDGWYVDASLFLTGETRPYKDGVFQRVKVKNPVKWGGGGGWGAWQIAGRYDVLNLSDVSDAVTPFAPNFYGACAGTRLGTNSITSPQPLTIAAGNPLGQVASNPARIAQCGDQETWIAGVNWYLNDYVRIMFNYMQTELDNYPTTITTTNSTPGLEAGTVVKGFDGATIRGFGTRVHVDW